MAALDESPDNAAAEVAHRTRRGISWNVIGAVLTNVMRFVGVAVLGRILSPHDFGIVAAALSVMLVVHQVRDIGIGAAIIQREDLDDGHIGTAFAVSVYMGLGLGLLLVLTAPLIGAFYKIDESVPVLRALGLLFAIRGLSTVSVQLCRRAMNFRAIAQIDAVTYIAGSIVSIVLATQGAGPWSLVIGYLAEETLAAILYIAARRPVFTLRIAGDKFRDLLGFGLGHTLIQVANILAIHGDNFVVGRTLGAEHLGYYTRAYELIKLPAAIFTNVVGNVLFPAFSRLQHDRDQLAIGLRRATFVNALVLLPLSALLIVIAPEVIRVIMGDQWDEVVLPFRILALVMMMRTSYKVGVAVASAAGSVYAVGVANVIYMLAVIGGAAITIRWGIPGVATSTACAIIIVYVHCSYLALRVSGLSVRAFIEAHGLGLVVALAIAAGMWPLASAMRSAELPVVVTLVVVSIAGALVTLVAVAVAGKRTASDAGWLRGELGRIGKKVRGKR
jgi:PST family polysaccharide transporter